MWRGQPADALRAVSRRGDEGADHGEGRSEEAGQGEKAPVGCFGWLVFCSVRFPFFFVCIPDSIDVLIEARCVSFSPPFEEKTDHVFQSQCDDQFYPANGLPARLVVRNAMRHDLMSTVAKY